MTNPVFFDDFFLLVDSFIYRLILVFEQFGFEISNLLSEFVQGRFDHGLDDFIKREDRSFLFHTLLLEDENPAGLGQYEGDILHRYH